MKFVAGQNAEVYEDDGKMVKYYAHCPYCGYLDSSKLQIQVPVVATAAARICPKCKKRFEIKFRRG